MARLEDLTTDTRVNDLAVSGAATVESGQWVVRDSDCHLGDQLDDGYDGTSDGLDEMRRPWCIGLTAISRCQPRAWARRSYRRDQLQAGMEKLLSRLARHSHSVRGSLADRNRNASHI